MSERLKSTSTVSNEDIVNDLTENLESSLAFSEQNVGTHPESSGERVDKENAKMSHPEPDSNTVDSSDSCDDTDSESDTEIDETVLKDAEMKLTEDEKADRQIIADELKLQGNAAFKLHKYELSIEKYTAGLRLCPLMYGKQRAILYCNRSAAQMKLENYKKAIKDCDMSIQLDEDYLKAYVRRAQSYELTEKYDEALADFKKVVELDPTNSDAASAIMRLPLLIEEQNEKLKTEMIEKLKNLGNMILRPFGLSTDNFKFQEDPETKGYKINFQQ